MSAFLLEFRVETEHCPFVRLTRKYPGVTLEYREMAHLPGDTFVEVFEVTGDEAAPYADAARSLGGVRDLKIYHDAPGRVSCQAVAGVECIRSRLASLGCVPLRVRAREGLEQVTVSVDDLDTARRVMDLAVRQYRGFTLIRLVPYHASGHTSRVGLDAFGFTARQEEALRCAFQHGYFDMPRREDSGDLAKRMGVDRSTFTRNLRGAMRRLLTTLVD